MRRSLASLALVLAAAPTPARACGCFALPNPATPVVQAGEQIVFGVDGQNVVAHIKVQYQGPAGEFGWLLPLPSLPDVSLGSNEMFDQLTQKTEPSYQLTTVRDNCKGGQSSSTSSGLGCGFGGEASNSFGGGDPPTTMDMAQSGPAVVTSSIGPYDYAVLKADDQSAMLAWLNANRYFIPATTSDVIAPYIHPGAYFLALKLRSGESTGNIQPVVVRYASDLPMIPIVLTQTGAIDDMGILVWVLGGSRAAPRNYRHTVLNDMAVWLASGARTYQQIVTSASREAPARHTFVTDYAGTSSLMHDQLAPAGRFANLGTLRGIQDPVAYVQWLVGDGFVLDDTTVGVLIAHLPESPEAIADGITPRAYFANFASWWATWAQADGGAPPAFDPGATTDELEMRVVQPTRDAQALFDAFPYLTRLYTTLSAPDMTVDPVFDFDPDLPQVGLAHTATLTYPCGGQAWLTDDQNLSVQWPAGQVQMPDSLRIEVIGESGPPTVETDNTAAIKNALGPVQMTPLSTASASDPQSGSGGPSAGCACSLPGRGLRGDLVGLALGLVALAGLRLRRRRAR